MIDEDYPKSITVLELRGFYAEAKTKLKNIFVANLRQPSFVSRAVISESSKTANKADQISISLPVGVAFSASQDSTGAWLLEELSECHYKPIIYSNKCSHHLCNGVFPGSLNRVYIYPNGDELDAAGNVPDEAESGVLRRLADFGLDPFLSMMIYSELKGLFKDLAEYNDTSSWE